MTPAMRKGTEKAQLSGFMSMKYPFMPKPNERPTDLAMFVIPLAADRSLDDTRRVTKV